MKKVVLFAVGCLLMLITYAQAPLSKAHLDAMNEAVFRHKIVVQFDGNVTLAQKQLLLQEYNMEVGWEVPEMSLTYVRLHDTPKLYTELKQVLEKLETHTSIRYATPILNSTRGSGYTTINELFVYPKDKASVEWIALQQKILSQEGSTIRSAPFLLGAYKIILQKDFEMNALELATSLNNTDWVAFAEPNYVVVPVVNSADTHYNRMWAHKNDSNTVFSGSIVGVGDADMDVDSAWMITRGDSTIKIAVIDSGVDTTHEDLMGNLLPGYDASGGNSNGYPNTDKTSNAHGTACAGIIGAVADNNLGIAGVAPNCKIVPVKVFYYIDTVLYGQIPLNDIPFSTSERFADAIHWSWQTANVDIMSNSWGLDDLYYSFLPGNPALVDSAIVQAATLGRGGLGTPMLFSSGNENTKPIWPSRLPETIAVNATSMCDERKFDGSCDGESWTGCWGTGLEISAPGVKIVTCDMMGQLGYSPGLNGHYTFTFNGTSAACPNAAGVAALMLSVKPDLTADAVRWLLGNTADTVGGYDYSTLLYAGNWSRELGYGRVNAHKAVIAARDYTGHSSLSGIANTANSEFMLSVYPNPSNGENIRLDFTIQQATDIHATIYNLNGQVVWRQHFGKMQQGAHSKVAPINLGAGVYVLSIEGLTNQTYQKIVVSQ